jgi:alpha-glucosidase (family GH31 glycosyl hydrolase)
MAHVAAKTGMPVLRAMSLAYPNDKRCDDYIHQYMFGECFLTSAFDDKVYLPEGRWIDFWTGKTFKGPIEIPAEFPENRGGTLFVKSGAVYPTQELCDFIGTSTPEKIIWEIFPEGNSEFTLREDDGESFEYLKGKIAETRLECSKKSGKISITLEPRKGSYKGMPEKRLHEIKLHCEKPKDANSDWTYNDEEKILTINPIQEKGKKIILEISF